MKCRFDEQLLTNGFLDLGVCPPSNSLLSSDLLNEPEVCYPLKLHVSERTWLVQVEEFKKAQDIFDNEYVYFSSYSTSWLKHCENYVEMITKRLDLNEDSRVVEIASNDGYLLQYFNHKSVPNFGIEPTSNTAEVARSKGVETLSEFFTLELANKLAAAGKQADLILGNNVFAHVPDINNFVSGLKRLLKASGTVTLEFPHLLQLMENNQFDTIYHEHFYYFSLHAVELVCKSHGLEVYDVDEILTHGGSLRVYLKHQENRKLTVGSSVGEVLTKEKTAGMLSVTYYEDFATKVNKIKNDLLTFLIKAKEEGAVVVAYGAAAKGNTLLNYCGIRGDLIEYVADLSPYKQGKFMPLSRIPIVSPDRIKQSKPDYILILPWNIKEEIMSQLDYVNEWGAKFVTAIPNITID